MPDTTPTTPAVWSADDPLMAAMAAAVWEQCATDLGHSITCDDPRNIAAVAVAVARQVLGTTDQQPATAEVCICGHNEAQHFEDCCQACDCGMYLVPEAARELITNLHTAVLRLKAPAPVDRAAVLREAAAALDADMERFFAEWPDELRNSPYASARKDASAHLRRMADEAQQPTGCTSAPCLHPGDCGHGCRAAADELSRETQQPEAPAPQCTAGLLPATDAAVDRCIRRGKHNSHATAAGVLWGNGSDDEPAADQPDTETEATK